MRSYIGAGAAAHTPGIQDVLVMLRLSGTSLKDAILMLSVSSSKDEGRPGSSERPLGSGEVSNSILTMLRDRQEGVKSLKEGAASIGVMAGGEEASESEKMKHEKLFHDRN